MLKIVKIWICVFSNLNLSLRRCCRRRSTAATSAHTLHTQPHTHSCTLTNKRSTLSATTLLTRTTALPLQPLFNNTLFITEPF